MGIPSQAQTADSDSDSRLRIRTLGGLSFHTGAGDPIHAATALRRPAALLVAVAAAGERGTTRDKLMGLLWPDSHPERARHSLTQAMYNARRVTGIDDLFLTDGAVRVNPARVSADFEEFELAFDQGDLERAAALYGGTFLDGFFVSDSPDFEQWASAKRARLEDAQASALERLAERAAAAGDSRRALEWRRRHASLRPLDSAAALAFVVALAQTGDRAGALQYAEQHAAMLREQLELEPDQNFSDVLATLRDPVATPRRVEAFKAPPMPAAPAVPAVTAVPVVEPTAPRPSRSRPRWRPRWRWALAGFAAVVLGSLTFRRDAASRTADHSVAPPPTLWVAPFDVSGASPSVEYLGRGVAQLLAERFDNIGNRRSFDAGVVATAWRDAGFDKLRDVARDSIVQLAAERGARRVIIGRIVGERSRAVLSATIFSIDSDSALATASVEGSADSVSVLATRLAGRLLVAEAHETFPIDLDTPLPALSAFLDGRRLYHDAAYTAAAHAFESALKTDSTFAPAALQLARVADRLGDPETEDAAIARAWQHREALDDASRDVLAALAGPRYPAPSTPREMLDAWSRVVRIWPQRAGSWYELGVRLSHDGRRLGVEGSGEQALAALNRALVLDPTHKPARDLLAHLALRPAAQGDRSLTAFHADSTSMLAPFLRWRAAVAHDDTAARRALRDDMQSFNGENIRAIALASQFDAVGVDDGRQAVDILASRASTGDERVDAVLAAHSLALNTGRISEALAQTTRLRDLRPDSHAYLRLRVLDAIYGSGDSAAARDAAVQLAAPVDSLLRDFPLVRSRVAADACVLAQWRLFHGDTTEVRAIVSLLRARDVVRVDQPVASAPAVCGDLVDAEFAFAAHRRDAVAMLDRLDSLVLSSPVAGNAAQYANIAISRMFRDLGDSHRALVALRKRDYMNGWPMYISTVFRDEASLARQLGDSRRASLSSDRMNGLRATSLGRLLNIPGQR